MVGLARLVRGGDPGDLRAGVVACAAGVGGSAAAYGAAGAGHGGALDAGTQTWQGAGGAAPTLTQDLRRADRGRDAPWQGRYCLLAAMASGRLALAEMPGSGACGDRYVSLDTQATEQVRQDQCLMAEVLHTGSRAHPSGPSRPPSTPACCSGTTHATRSVKNRQADARREGVALKVTRPARHTTRCGTQLWPFWSTGTGLPRPGTAGPTGTSSRRSASPCTGRAALQTEAAPRCPQPRQLRRARPARGVTEDDLVRAGLDQPYGGPVKRFTFSDTRRGRPTPTKIPQTI